MILIRSIVTDNVSVRIVAATNADLQEIAAEMQFRDDLCSWIKVIPIAIPPLREHCTDIPPSTISTRLLAG